MNYQHILKCKPKNSSFLKPSPFDRLRANGEINQRLPRYYRLNSFTNHFGLSPPLTVAILFRNCYNTLRVGAKIMRFLLALTIIPFVTIPSIVYSIIYFISALPISLIIRPFTGGIIGVNFRAAIISNSIAAKLTPIFLVIVLPIVFYLYAWKILALIFFTWTLLYFILRRFSGVSKWQARYGQSLKDLDRTARELKDKQRTR